MQYYGLQVLCIYTSILALRNWWCQFFMHTSRLCLLTRMSIYEFHCTRPGLTTFYMENHQPGFHSPKRLFKNVYGFSSSIRQQNPNTPIASGMCVQFSSVKHSKVDADESLVILPVPLNKTLVLRGDSLRSFELSLDYKPTRSRYRQCLPMGF